MTPPREWDATDYDKVAAPMTTRGVELVDELDLDGDETVLDAGCGTGQVTAHLLERLPHGRVIALDGSRRMLDVAGERFGGDDRVTLVHADLTQPLPVDEVDAVVSTSTFHWVPDHQALFARIADRLKPEGQLRFECGGAGNVQRVLDVLQDLGIDENPWTFETAEETTTQLEAAGFTDVTTRLHTRHAPIPPEELETYLRSVVLGDHVQRHGPELAARVAARLPEPVIDYVRLIGSARLTP